MPTRLARTMKAHDPRGVETVVGQQPPPSEAKPDEAMEEWKIRRLEILQGMRAVMGPLPGNEKRVDFDVRVEEEVDAGSYLRRLITFQSEPHCRTPAYLCIPKAALFGEQKSAGCPLPSPHRQSRWSPGRTRLGWPQRSAVRSGVGGKRLCHAVSGLPASRELLAESWQTRLRERHHESDLG